MTLSITVPDKTEARLRELAQAAGTDVATFVRDAIEEKIAATSAPAPTPSASDWSRQWRAWAASHPAAPNPVDDSRESIYAGRLA